MKPQFVKLDEANPEHLEHMKWLEARMVAPHGAKKDPKHKPGRPMRELPEYALARRGVE